MDAAPESWNEAAHTDMGEANQRESGLDREREREHVVVLSSEVVALGVRVDRERETTPAPASISGEFASFPSARPTSVPDYDVAAHAFESSLRHQQPARLPLDVAIPTRTFLTPPPDLELRAAFVLLHVDGRSSVGEIAELTMLPVDEVLGTFLGLTAVGLVTLGGTQESLGVPTSGERDRT